MLRLVEAKKGATETTVVWLWEHPPDGSTFLDQSVAV